MGARGRWDDLPVWVRREAYGETLFLAKFTLVTTAVISLTLIVGRQASLIPGVAAILGGAWFLAYLGLCYYWPWVMRLWLTRQGVIPPRKAPPRHQRFSAILEIGVGVAISFLFGLAFAGAIASMFLGEEIFAGTVIVAAILGVGVVLALRGWKKWRSLPPIQPT